MRYLVVEDDYEIARHVTDGLINTGATVDAEPNGLRAFERATSSHYDAIVLDLSLPDMDGYTFAQSLREKGMNTPILILSAYQNLEDKLKGFSTGCDDYLCKPFSMAELQIRTKNLVRRSQGTRESVRLGFKDLEINRLKRQVTRAGKIIDLQDREFRLLNLFVSNPEKVISKQMILKEVWNYDFDPQTNVVDVLVCRLRAKIEKDFPTALIYTVRNFGYILK
ncbi:response regulator transcription factor [Bdellovibrio sp. BCCA]|uniref:response regulator transcription factor n=1 Tax=Bdellovibrio sp. BCCA TaxID=3136281 RepID=UPI0030F24974